MFIESSIVNLLPSATDVRHRLGGALREVEQLRSLLRLAERVEKYRERDRDVAQERECVSRQRKGRNEENRSECTRSPVR